MKKIEILRVESGRIRAPLVIEGYSFEGSDIKLPSNYGDLRWWRYNLGLTTLCFPNLW